MSELLSIIDSLLEYKYEQEHIMKDNEKRKFEKILNESRDRMNDDNYVTKLKELGYIR